MTDTTTQPRQIPDAEPPPEHEAPWWRTEVDGRSVGFWITVGLAIAAVTLGFGAWWTFGLDRGPQMAGGMAGQPAPGGQTTTVRPGEELGPLLERMDNAEVDAVLVTRSDGRMLGMLERTVGEQALDGQEGHDDVDR